MAVKSVMVECVRAVVILATNCLGNYISLVRRRCFIIKIHHLKILPSYFFAIREGIKTFEIRKNDRNYQVGDILQLKEFDVLGGGYTGNELYVKVIYTLSEQPYVPVGYICMSILIEDDFDKPYSDEEYE